MHIMRQCRAAGSIFTPEIQTTESRAGSSAQRGAAGMLAGVPFGVIPVAKAKTPPARPAAPPRSRIPGLNPRLDLERRRLLQKHYRARYGVK